MNDLVLLCLIFFMCVRIIGLAVAIDYFHDTKDNKFIYIIIGWIFWIIASLFPIFSSIVENNNIKELYLVLNALFGLIGGIFYTWGFFRYFIILQFKKMVLLVAVSILLPISLYFLINFRVAIQLSAAFVNFLILATYIFPRLYVKDFKNFMGRSIRWYNTTSILLISYFPIYITISLLGYNYGLYEADNTLIIILYYIPTVCSSILFIILLVHLEYTISTRQKFDLKDKYSHNLGNIMQVINSSSDLLNMTTNLSAQENENFKLIQAKCKEASRLIKNIRKL